MFDFAVFLIFSVLIGLWVSWFSKQRQKKRADYLRSLLTNRGATDVVVTSATSWLHYSEQFDKYHCDYRLPDGTLKHNTAILEIRAFGEISDVSWVSPMPLSFRKQPQVAPKQMAKAPLTDTNSAKPEPIAEQNPKPAEQVTHQSKEAIIEALSAENERLRIENELLKIALREANIL